jgi:hypothetical protein
MGKGGNMQGINITPEETKVANDEGRLIFGYLRKKYCNDNIRDLDIVLNSIAFAALQLIHLNVRAEDRPSMVEIFTNILREGIK